MEKQECLFLQVAGYCKVTLLLQSLTFRDANFWKTKIWRLFLLHYPPLLPLNINKHNPGKLAYIDFPDGKLLILIQSPVPHHSNSVHFAASIVWFQKLSTSPPQKGSFLTPTTPPPHLSGNSSQASYIYLKLWAFENPTPRNFQSPLCVGTRIDIFWNYTLYITSI